MKTILGWPFLVSRNRTLDYTVIVAPDFLIHAGQEQYLRSWTENSTNRRIAITEINDPQLGILSIVFRKFEAVDENNDVLKDEIGRPILWIDGLVFRESLQGFVISEEQLNESYSNLFDIYENFWESDEYSNAVQSSAVDVNLFPGKFEHQIDNPSNEKSRWNSTKDIQKKRRQRLLDEKVEAQNNLRKGIIFIVVGIPTLLILIGFYLLPKGIMLVINSSRKIRTIDDRLQNE